MKNVQTFFDPDTWTLTHLVFDPQTKDAVLFDPVLNYEPNGSSYWFESLEEVTTFIKSKELNLHYVIDTHAHADHISGAFFLIKEFPNTKYVIGTHIKKVQNVFKDIFNLTKLKTDGSQFDILIEDGESLEAGSIKIKAIHTPGHTPTCTSYLIDDMVFVGDSLFMPDFGTGRCDFPEGSASDLYHSIHEKLYNLPNETKVYVGHDYMPGGRKLAWQTTIKDSKEQNIHLKQETTEAQFVSFRQERDKTLTAPRLLLPSIQINADGARLPEVEENNTPYLKLPLKQR